MSEAVSSPKKLSTAELVYIAVCAALMALCSWISIPAVAPLPPFTLQTFAAFLIVLLLGGRRGTLAMLVYILLGAIGLPVFSHFRGGIGVLLDTTGGYIVGFLFIGLIYRAAERVSDGRTVQKLAALVLGLLVCYAFGTAWFMVVYARKSGPVGLSAALSWCVLPFIIPDLVKLALAWSLAVPLKKQVRL
ncbi:MAG: biotin transporter BioY [Oscillospiraceae bacterium]|nr:biotin transporter BioY [Oscillospiraceae bacterium]